MMTNGFAPGLVGRTQQALIIVVCSRVGLPQMPPQLITVRKAGGRDQQEF